MNGNYYNPNNNQNMNPNMGPNMNQQMPNQGPNFDPYNNNYDPNYDYFGKAPKSSFIAKLIKLIIILAIIAGLGFGGYKGYKYLSKTVKDTIKEEKKKEEDKKAPTDEIPYDKDNPIYQTDEYGVPKKVFVQYGDSMYGDVSPDGKLSIYNKRVIPSLINTPYASKIVKTLSDASAVYWNPAVKQTDEDFANYDPATTQPAKYGIQYYATHELYRDNRLLVFNCVLTGSMGGDTWDALEIFGFDLRNGDILDLDKLCIDVNTCENFLYTTFVESLKRDERFTDLLPDYEKLVKENLFKVGNYGYTKKGFALIIPKGVIASNASNVFAYVIPFDTFNEYLKEEFRI